MAQRFDRGSLKKPRKLPNGFLRGDAFVTRVGVFDYLNSDGTTRKELRHPDDVFSADSLATLSMIPITAGHPPYLLDAATVRKHTVGTTGEKAQPEGSFVRSTVQVQDAEAIGKVESNEMRELSCGYRCDKDETPGVTQGIPGIPDGLHYDLRQTNIQYNHLALTELGRAGPECSVPRMDGLSGDTAVMVLDSNDRPNPTPSPRLDSWSGNMDAVIRIDGIEYKTTEQAAQAFRQYAERTDKAAADAAAAATEAKTNLEKEKARADAAEEKAKKAETERADALKPESIQKIVTDRVALEKIAVKVLGEKTEDGTDIKVDAMTDLEIKTAVIKKTAPTANLDGKEEAYISARYEHAIESLPETERTDADTSRAAVHDAATGPKPGANTDANDARIRMIKRQEEAYKGKDQQASS
jgi:hypothetical protein